MGRHTMVLEGYLQESASRRGLPPLQTRQLEAYRCAQWTGFGTAACRR